MTDPRDETHFCKCGGDCPNCAAPGTDRVELTDTATVLPNYEWRWKKSEEHKRQLREKLKVAQAERDAARAEVERLRKELSDRG